MHLMGAHITVINALENTTSHRPLHFVTRPYFLTVTYTGFVTLAAVQLVLLDALNLKHPMTLVPPF